MTIFGYARVSTDGQTLDAQREALTQAGAAKIYQETASGAKGDRKELAKSLKSLGSGDTLLVTRLDRLARSTRDLLNILDTVSKSGAAFRSLSDMWADTSTAHGRLMLTVLGGLAEFERELIRTRTGEGRVRAKARGQHMGRPPALTRHQIDEAARDLNSGAATQADLARRFNVSQSTISRLADKNSDNNSFAIKANLPTIKPKLDAQTLLATRAFMQRIEPLYSIHHALLYGSRARNTHSVDSDADIAVILNGERGNRAEAIKDMAGIAYHVMVETGIMVEALPLWQNELQNPEIFTNQALINNILREGVRL